MKSISLILGVLFLATGITCKTKQDLRHQNLQILIESERTFARTSAEIGMRSAFTRWLDDSAIVFRPRPEKGKARYQNSPDVPEMLIWQPEFADISAAGDLGYTTGPYEFRRQGMGTPADGYGHFVSIWKIRSDGSWRVLIDGGISHVAPGYSLSDTTLPVLSPDFISTEYASTDTTRLFRLDAAFTDSAAALGYRRALQIFAVQEIRIYRENQFPFPGLTSLPLDIDEPLVWEPLSAGLSFSGDLGYTYGIARGAVQPEGSRPESSYLRIWRKTEEAQWKLVLEMTNPIL